MEISWSGISKVFKEQMDRSVSSELVPESDPAAFPVVFEDMATTNKHDETRFDSTRHTGTTGTAPKPADGGPPAKGGGATSENPAGVAKCCKSHNYLR